MIHADVPPATKLLLSARLHVRITLAKLAWQLVQPDSPSPWPVPKEFFVRAMEFRGLELRQCLEARQSARSRTVSSSGTCHYRPRSGRPPQSRWHHTLAVYSAVRFLTNRWTEPTRRFGSEPSTSCRHPGGQREPSPSETNRSPMPETRAPTGDLPRPGCLTRRGSRLVLSKLL